MSTSILAQFLNASVSTVANSLKEESTDAFLSEISDEELQKTVRNLRVENWQMTLENDCFEKYLFRVDPSALIGLQVMVNNVRKRNSTKSVRSVHSRASSGLITRKSLRESAANDIISTARKSSASRKSIANSIHGFSASLSVLERGPRVNIAIKTDIVDRETEELKLTLEKLVAKSAIRKTNLKAQTEEICIRTAETKESRLQFEKVVITEGVDPLTKRIPAEKFIYFMEDWLKNVSSTTENLRLKTDTMRFHYNRLRQQFAMKQELGQSLRPIDFEALVIENEDHIKTIDEKNNHLLGLKKVNGITNLTLSVQKKNLLAAIQKLKQIEQTIRQTGNLIADMIKEEEIADKEVEKVSKALEKLEVITSEYTAPPMIDYVRKIAELNKVEEQIKIWTRKRNIQRIAINSFR